MSGTGILMLVPLLSLSGILPSMDSSNFILKSFQGFFSTFPHNVNLFLILVLFICIICIQSILNMYTSILNTEITQEFSKNLRIELFQNIIYSKWLCLSNKRLSDLTNSFTMEISRVSYGTLQLLTVVSQIITALIQIAIAFMISAPVTLLVIINGIILFLFMNTFLKESKKLGKSLLKINRELQLQVTEHLNSVREIKSYGVEKNQIDKFEELNTQMKNNFLGFTRIQSKPDLIYKISSAIIISLFFYTSVVFLKVNPSKLLIIIIIFGRLWPIFSSFQNSLQNIFVMLPSFDNITKLNREFSLNSEIVNSAADALKSENHFKFNNCIEFKNINFKYTAEDYILKNINLKIPHKSFTAIVGSSGSGKSTLANILMGLITPQEGSITIDSHPLTENNIMDWRNNLAYVSQDPFIFNATIKENLLRFNPNAKDEDIYKALRLSYAEEFVKKLPSGIDTIIGDRGVKLSGGERQRIVLARALLRNPSILILDEATSSLDVENESKIQKSIEELRGKLTLIVIAHRLSTIKNSDNIVVIKDGTIIEEGNYENLNKSGGYFSELLNI